MPWSPSDASAKTKKAKTAKQKRQWSDIANTLYGKGVSEGQAIREANAVIAKGAKK